MALLVVAALGGSLGAPDGVAQAATAAQASSTSGIAVPASGAGELIKTPMRIVGFDAAVAKAHGYRIVTRNGVQESVGVSGKSSTGPDTTIYGDCGYSWVWLGPGYMEFYYDTGFQLYYQGYDFNWLVHLYGPNAWEQSRTWGGLLYGGERWRAPASGNYTVYVDDPGYYRGVVDSGSSYAILDNGGICYSGGPQMTVYVSGP